MYNKQNNIPEQWIIPQDIPQPSPSVYLPDERLPDIGLSNTVIMRKFLGVLSPSSEQPVPGLETWVLVSPDTHTMICSFLNKEH